MNLVNKQSVLDDIPCSTLNQFLPVLIPSLNDISDDSLREGFFPTVIKMAIRLLLMITQFLIVTQFLQKMDFLPIEFRVDFKNWLMVYKCINKQAREYLKCMLLRLNTDSENRTRQDYDKIGLRVPPVEKLTYK